MSRNEKEYGPDTDAFRPGRFLDSNARDPGEYVFGFGRRCDLIFAFGPMAHDNIRICTGRYMAENTTFIAISCILHVFILGRALNEDGTEKPLVPNWQTGLTT